MTDADPRIFRNLESPTGRGSFDNIVLAAVAAYAELAMPSTTQMRDFARLVAPLFARTSAETRRMAGASLAAAPRLPREVVELLVAQEPDVAAPFLLSTTLLTPDDLAVLGKRRKAARRRAPAKAPAAPAGRKRAPAATPDVPAAPERPLVETAARAAPRLSSSRQTQLLSGGLTREPDARLNAAETREALRRLVQPGAQRTEPKPADLLSLAIARDIEAFHLLLAATLFLDRTQLARIERDRSGSELAIALKAAGLGTADAMTVLMMLKPAIGTDVVAFETMERSYSELSAAECAARFRRGTPRHAPLHEEAAAPPRPQGQPQPSFGRRSAIPADTRRTGEKHRGG